jgi:hypothetical protein
MYKRESDEVNQRIAHLSGVGELANVAKGKNSVNVATSAERFNRGATAQAQVALDDLCSCCAVPENQSILQFRMAHNKKRNYNDTFLWVIFRSVMYCC